MSFFTPAAQTQTVQVDENMSRRVLAHGGTLMYVHLTFAKALDPESEIPLHNHVHEQMSYVLKGSFKFQVSDAQGNQETKVVQAGDSLYLPAMGMHGMIPLEDDSQLLDCFTPQRFDFL